jgi:uncharacterized membrane protein YhaH (DUF805 family)
MAIAHFAVGVSVATIMLIATGNQNHRFNTIPMFVFGLLAFAPDFHLIVDNVIGAEMLDAFHSSVYANIFFFHQIIDSIDKQNSTEFAFLCLSIMVVCLAVFWGKVTVTKFGNN